MSHLGQTIKRLRSENRLTQKIIAKKTGLPQSQLSRWESGEISFISPKDLDLLAGALGRTRRQRAEVIAAHLFDECSGSGSELIDILIRGQEQDAQHETAPVYRTRLAPETQAVLDYFAEIIPKNRDAENALVAFAKTLGFESK